MWLEHRQQRGSVWLGIELAENIIGKYVTDVTVSNDGKGTITATFGSGNHAGKFLRLTPTETDGAVYFDCTTDIEEDWRPSNCEDGSGGVSVTLHSVDPPEVEGEGEVVEEIVDLPEDPVVATTPSGTAYGSSWDALTPDEQKCGKAENKNKPECQFPICWKGTSSGGNQWIVGWNGFQSKTIGTPELVDKMLAMQERAELCSSNPAKAADKGYCPRPCIEDGCKNQICS